MLSLAFDIINTCWITFLAALLSSSLGHGLEVTQDGLDMEPPVFVLIVKPICNLVTGLCSFLNL